MRTRRAPLTTLVATALLLLLAAPAAAQPSHVSPHTDDGRGYEVRFLDDLLAGGGLDGSTPILRVAPHALRSQLIRPRTSFVPELLKSADAH